MVSGDCEMKRLLLHKFHKAHGLLQEFSGFEMPFWYERVISEHMTVREMLVSLMHHIWGER